MGYDIDPQWLHPACALDVDTVAFTSIFNECRESLRSWGALDALVTTRNAAIDSTTTEPGFVVFPVRGSGLT